MVWSSLDNSSLMFVRLDSTDFVESFDCGDADLNDFITNQADSFAKALLSVSCACVDSTCGKTLAFCSLANDKVSISDFNDKTEYNRFRKHQGFPQGKRLKSYPAVKLCRFLTVDAYLAAIPFYEKNGFVFLNETDKNNPYTRLMYFDLMDIVG